MAIATLLTNKNSAFSSTVLLPEMKHRFVILLSFPKHTRRFPRHFLIPGWAEGGTSLEWPAGVKEHYQEQERPSWQSLPEQTTVEKQL